MRHATTAAAVLFVAACSGGGTSDTIQPGNWETTTQMTSIDAPGMPAEALEQMRAQLASQRQTNTSCITPEQAANPAADLVNPEGESSGCQFSKSTFAGGEISVEGTCPGPAGAGSMRMSWQGRYTATTMEGEIETEIQGGPQSMKMNGTMASRRVGDCPAGESAAS